jgi:hypothetical protein
VLVDHLQPQFLAIHQRAVQVEDDRVDAWLAHGDGWSQRSRSNSAGPERGVLLAITPRWISLVPSDAVHARIPIVAFDRQILAEARRVRPLSGGRTHCRSGNPSGPGVLSSSTAGLP